MGFFCNEHATTGISKNCEHQGMARDSMRSDCIARLAAAPEEVMEESSYYMFTYYIL